MATRDKYSLNAAGIPLITAYNGSFYLLVGKVGGCFFMCMYVYIYIFIDIDIFVAL